MNAFQKQLKLGDKCMAELAGQGRNGVGQAVPPARVSVEEFLSRPTKRAVDVCPACRGSGDVDHSKENSPVCRVCDGTGKRR